MEPTERRAPMRGVKGSGRAGNRTQNLAIKSRLLCQLSYSSVPPGRLRGRETSGRPSALKNYLLRFPPARPPNPRRSRSTARSPPPRHAADGSRHQPNAAVILWSGLSIRRMKAGSSGISIAPRRPSPTSPPKPPARSARASFFSTSLKLSFGPSDTVRNSTAIFVPPPSTPLVLTIP